MGKYDQFLAGLPTTAPEAQPRATAQKSGGKYDQFLSGLDNVQAAEQQPTEPSQKPADYGEVMKSALNEARMGDGSFMRKMMSDPITQAQAIPYLSGAVGVVSPLPMAGSVATVAGRQLSNQALRAYGRKDLIPSVSDQVTEGVLAGGTEAIGAAARGVGKAYKFYKNARNAPKALESALGDTRAAYGTMEAPYESGMVAREGQLAEEAANEAMANKLYSEIPEGVPVSTKRLAEGYSEMADELPPSFGNAIKKHVQLEPNPIRTNDIGTTNTKIYGRSMPDNTFVIPHQYTASPGVPSQLPEKMSSIQDLIKLRSKLGAAARSGGIDGYNAGKLKALLDEDIANLGAGEGPLGKMTNEAVNKPLKRATNYYRELMEHQGNPLYKQLEKADPKAIPDLIFKGGSPQKVLMARSAIGEKGFQAAKKSFLNGLLESKDLTKELAKYEKNNSGFLNVAFGKSELDSLRRVAQLQKTAEESTKALSRAKKFAVGAGAIAAGSGVLGSAIRFGGNE